MFRTAAAVAALAILFDVVHAAQGSRQFSCNGGMIESTPPRAGAQKRATIPESQ